MSATVQRADAERSRTPPGLAMLALGALVFLGCGVARLTGYGAAPAPAPVVAQVSLHFNDMPNGTVDVVDLATGRVIDVIAAGKGGFLRSTMRVMATEREVRHLGPQKPFTLLATADNRLQLIDTATGQVLELEAFGPSNEAVFAKILYAAGDEK